MIVVDEIGGCDGEDYCEGGGCDGGMVERMMGGWKYYMEVGVYDSKDSIGDEGGGECVAEGGVEYDGEVGWWYDCF